MGTRHLNRCECTAAVTGEGKGQLCSGETVSLAFLWPCVQTSPEPLRPMLVVGPLAGGKGVRSQGTFQSMSKDDPSCHKAASGERTSGGTVQGRAGGDRRKEHTLLGTNLRQKGKIPTCRANHGLSGCPTSQVNGARAPSNITAHGRSGCVLARVCAGRA